MLLLHIPDVAPEAGTPPQDIAIFIIGTVFGLLLHQREQVVLRASAARVGGKAVLFCGASGAGKSPLAAALAQCGYPLITDDVCALAVTDRIYFPYVALRIDTGEPDAGKPAA